MKKLLLSVMLATAGLAVSAQTNPVKFGLRGGATFPTMSFSENSEGAVRLSTSFYIGGTVDFSLSNQFSIQPGFTLLGKGTKLKISGDIRIGNEITNIDGTGTINLLYAEVPLNLVARFPLANGRVFIGAGPYYAVAINGEQKVKVTVTYDGQSESDSSYEDIKFGKDEVYKRNDMGLNFIAGYELGRGINFQAGYGLGLTSIVNSDDEKVRNRVLSIGLGYTF